MEKVLCIKREHLTKVLSNPLPQGAFKDIDIQALYTLPHTFIPRNIAETNPEYKQIIPYQIITLNNTFFVYERNINSSESRLHGLLSIGVGGHINEYDTKDLNHPNLKEIIFASLNRERCEEIYISGILSERFIGLINDDSQPVGQVHLGLVFLIEITSKERLKVNDVANLKYIGWWSRREIEENASRFETWSILALNLL